MSNVKDGSPMTKSDAARIQAGQKKSGGDMSSDGFAARAQAAAATNKASGQKPESGGKAEQGKSQGTALPRGDKKVASGGGW